MATPAEPRTEPPIRGVLFDSGDTLVRPIGGRWNPRFDFEDTVRAHLPGIVLDRFADAASAGDRFLEVTSCLLYTSDAADE